MQLKHVDACRAHRDHRSPAGASSGAENSRESYHDCPFLPLVGLFTPAFFLPIFLGQQLESSGFEKCAILEFGPHAQHLLIVDREQEANSSESLVLALRVPLGIRQKQCPFNICIFLRNPKHQRSSFMGERQLPKRRTFTQEGQAHARAEELAARCLAKKIS